MLSLLVEPFGKYVPIEKMSKTQNLHAKQKKNNFIYVKYISRLKTSTVFAIIPIEL